MTNEPDPSDLRHLMETLDDAEQVAGWGAPAQLVGVEGRRLSYVQLDGHPLDFLLGWTAPAPWSAIALVAGGWAAVDNTADVERNVSTRRASRAFGRRRVPGSPLGMMKV